MPNNHPQQHTTPHDAPPPAPQHGGTAGQRDIGTAGPRDYLLSVVDGKPGVGPTLLRGLLRALSGLYWLGLHADMTFGGTLRLPVQVISVGNLSMGGTGKTLAVLRLARELQAEGKRVAVLSRGYRRKSREAMAVVSTPEQVLLSPTEAGDEPCLLAHSLPGVPVLVGKDRRRTGRYALDHFPLDVLLLDDGGQYWRLHKDREIVLLDALQPAGRDHLLPRGLLREPLRHLRRAHEVWITHAALADPTRLAALVALAARYAPGAMVRCLEHQPEHLCTPAGEILPLSTLQGRRVLALSGLGNPVQFERMLAALGADVTPCRYPDHHAYTAADLAAIAAALQPDMLLVTTPKDAIRLPAALPFPLLIAEVALADVAR